MSILPEVLSILSQGESMKCKKNIYIGISFLVFFLLLPGCGSKKNNDQAMVQEQDPAAIGKEEPLDSKDIGVMEGRTTGPMFPVYFEYDSYGIRDDQKPRIQVNADFLTKEQSVKIRIEGNCDSRGTREYNLALGEKRALSAKKYLINLGVSSERIATVSLGEEKILIHGHDEMTWAQNRRDDFVVE
jgi:peptidoglycan-associated lipoprotein